MEVSCSWCRGGESVVGATILKPENFQMACELSIHIKQECAGVELTCSARTCEVSAARAGGFRSYCCTLRGAAAAGAAGDFVFQYRPQAGLAPGVVVILKLLSLCETASVRVHSVELLACSEVAGYAAAVAESAGGDASSQASQMEGIRSMLRGMAATSDAQGDAAEGDPKRAFMAALARSALIRGAHRQPAAPAPHANAAGAVSGSGTEPQYALLLQLVKAQAQALGALQASVDRLESRAAETQALVQQLARAMANRDGSVGGAEP